jgi:hypothetical protein
MAGLNNIISNTATQSTTMPSWFDTAQQNVVSGAGTALGQAPTPQNTVAQNAVNQMAAPNNAFTQATGTLQGIASGAANPWITNAATGQVTPNTNTALGGLFQAQNQQLNQVMPQYTAPVDAGSIGSGNFGSLRGQTAYNKAMGDAAANLFAQQNQAALQNQQTGVQAGIGAGNVAQQDINNALTVGQYQQASPFANISNYGKVIGGVQAPTTVSNQTQLSPLNQIMGAINLLGGSTGSGGALAQLFGSGTKGQADYKPGLVGTFTNLFSPSTPAGGGTYTPTNPAAGSNTSGGYGTGTGGGGLTPNPDGTFTNSNGDIISESGSLISTGSGPDYNAGSDTNNQPIPDYTGSTDFYNPTNDAGPADYSDSGYSSDY